MHTTLNQPAMQGWVSQLACYAGMGMWAGVGTVRSLLLNYSPAACYAGMSGWVGQEQLPTLSDLPVGRWMLWQHTSLPGLDGGVGTELAWP